jgi:two-component system, LuxR family, response regulator FixJ
MAAACGSTALARVASSISRSLPQSHPSVAEPMQIALIDDDEAVLDSLRLYFSRQDIDAAGFSSARDFLAALERSSRFDCVVSDVRMPGMSGLDLVRDLNRRGFAQPIILITGHGDIDMAVAAIKIGAFDFIEKPFDEGRLLASIRNAARKDQKREGQDDERQSLLSRFNTLSQRQRQVMELAAAGRSNKEIGAELNISPKTVENHRAWVMERIGARNVAELVRIAMKIQEKS